MVVFAPYVASFGQSNAVHAYKLLCKQYLLDIHGLIEKSIRLCRSSVQLELHASTCQDKARLRCVAQDACETRRNNGTQFEPS